MNTEQGGSMDRNCPDGPAEQMAPEITTLFDVNIFDPEDGDHSLDLEIEWRKVSSGYKAFLNEGGLGYPGQGPVWEIVSVKATNCK